MSEILEQANLPPETREYLENLMNNFKVACEQNGGTAKVDLYELIHYRAELLCEGLPSDEAIERVYRTVRDLHQPKGIELIRSKITGDGKEVDILVTDGKPSVKISEKKPLPNSFAVGFGRAIKRGIESEYISCKHDGCYITYEMNGDFPEDYLQAVGVIERVFEKAIAPVIEFGEQFTKECESSGGVLDGVVCKVGSKEAADRLFKLMSNYGGEAFGQWNLGFTASIYYGGNGESYKLVCEAGNPCKIYARHEESVEVPEDILESDVLEKFLDHTKFWKCSVGEDSVVCKYNWFATPNEGDMPSEVLRHLSELTKDLIDILDRSAEDLKKGNVWVQAGSRDVCGVPFYIYEKNGEEIALGFGTGASGGYGFWDVEEIPDTMMKEMYEHGFAGEAYLLDDMEEECREEEEGLEEGW